MFSTAGHNYRSAKVYRDLVQSGSIKPNTPHEKYKYISNYKPVGSTWDAHHLDQFLNTSQFATISTTTSTRGSLRPQTRQSINILTTNFTQPTDRNYSVTPVDNRPYLETKKADYLTGNSTNFMIREARNATNNLVADPQVNPMKTTAFFEREFKIPEQTYDVKKLEFSEQPVRFTGPRERRSEVLETKRNQEELSKWKEQRASVTRKFRIIKGAFKSGVIGIDNPMNDSTLLYTDEHRKIQTVKAKAEEIEKKRLTHLIKVNKTNSMIEAHNKNFDPKYALPALKIIDDNAKKPVIMPHTEKWKNSDERLFNQPLKRYSIDRSNFLKTMETRGRNWNILNSASIDFDASQIKRPQKTME